MLVVATQNDLSAIRSILAAAQRVGCHIRWLQPDEVAPKGSVAFFTKRGRGPWARLAARKVFVGRDFDSGVVEDLTQKVRRIVSCSGQSTAIEDPSLVGSAVYPYAK